MVQQRDLFNNGVQTPTGASLKKPYGDDCVPACYNAREERCTCRCGGKYHGVGSGHKRRTVEPAPDPVLPKDTEAFFKAQMNDRTCSGNCGYSELDTQPIHYYPHDGGWRVPGMGELQWLYIRCPKCGYDWALWKLGVKR